MPDPVDLIIGPVLAEDLFAKTENPVEITVGVRTSPQGQSEFWDVNVEVENPIVVAPDPLG